MRKIAEIDKLLEQYGRDSGGCRIALVGVEERPICRSPILDDIRRLVQEGCTVLCYADGARDWPIGVQCHLLLAGASHLFDSSTATFVHELRERIEELQRVAGEHERELEDLRQQMLALGVIGTSRAITDVFRCIVTASAVSDWPVLIVGETGTGKELAAQSIHRLDARRRDRPFVPVNCGAISAALAESELFGHRRGAFTGADRDRIGLIRAARGGVLFLDEIGDLDLNLQSKLLRVLQERRVLAVGDEHEVPVDVRVIAATNQDLDEMVRKGTFRADLFHRLNVITVRVPALRERPEDIALLIEHFVASCNNGTHGAVMSASNEFIDALRRLELPGNVRQLENVIRYAVVSATCGGKLRLRNLPPELWLELSRTDGGAGAHADAADASPARHRPSSLNPTAVLDATGWKLERALDLCEEHLVAAALGASSGNRTRAARLLGISPRCIFNKMRKHRLTA